MLLYTNNKLSGRETKKNSIYNGSKRTKYLSFNLTNEIKDLDLETRKTLMKEIEDKKNKQTNKYLSCSWTVRINIVEIAVLPKAIYRFSVIPIKLAMTYLNKMTASNSKICMGTKAPR